MHFGILLISVIFLLSSAILAGLTTALLKLGKLKAKEEFRKIPTLFFFQHFLKSLFGSQKWEGLFFTLSFTKHVLHLSYGVVTIFMLIIQDPFIRAFKLLEPHNYTLDTLWIVIIGAIIISISLITDMIMKFIASAAPRFSLKLFSPIASIFMTLLSPMTALFMKLFPHSRKEEASPPSIRDKILEVLYESELSAHLDPQERKLILSVANFKQRMAREVMVPRIDVTTLPEETTIQEALGIFLKERYSRIPVYKDSIDHISGVLLYKDVLSAYVNSDQAAPIRSLIKSVVYTPETKKIAQLLQEFRSKQLHLAIVVDEYGGTEGIITIEDILEELVGEIADEDDTDQETLFSVLPSGGWIVDARMGILDIEKEIGIKIPTSAEYDTLGGYIYHRAGAIPSRGWRLHHDDFDLEILSSDERSLEKVHIIPRTTDQL